MNWMESNITSPCNLVEVKSEEDLQSDAESDSIAENLKGLKFKR